MDPGKLNVVAVEAAASAYRQKFASPLTQEQFMREVIAAFLNALPDEAMVRLFERIRWAAWDTADEWAGIARAALEAAVTEPER